jgi:hypothetical protein
VADNTTLNSGSGGDVIASDDIGGVKYPRSKIVIGADGTNDGDVSAANPLPITASSLPLPSGAATSAAQATHTTHLATLAGAVSGAEMQVDVVTSALPAGAATSAAQSTQTTHLATIAGAISGSEMQADVLTQPARAATTDSIAAKHATDAIMDGLTALTPKFAKIDAATSGDNTLVAAVASKKIRVLALFLVAVADVVARFESGAGGTALTGQMDLTANSGFTLPFSPVGWFETASNTLLNLELDGAVSVDGCLVYVEV